MRTDGRVEPGQPIRSGLSARAWNRAQQAADIVLGVTPSFSAGSAGDGIPSHTSLYAKNNTTGDAGRWGVLAIAGMEIVPSGTTGAALEQFERSPLLSGGLPTGGNPFVIALEPIAVGSLGRVAVAGVVQVMLNITDAAHTFATAKDGDLTQLQSATSGEATILWKDSGTGSGKRALVRFGAAGASGGSRLAKTSGTWTKGATASVTQWNGDGSTAVTGPSGPATFVAINRAQTVTGPTGGFWVGCNLVDSTWHLAWTEC